MMLDLEHMDDESLERLRDIYERLASRQGCMTKKEPDHLWLTGVMNHSVRVRFLATRRT